MKKMVSIVVIAVMISGCVWNPKVGYPMADIPHEPHSPFSQTSLTILEFQDIREPVVSSGKSWGWETTEFSDTTWFYNSNDRYKEHVVAPWLTLAIYRHIVKSGLYNYVTISTTGAHITTDYLLTGKIAKFNGYVEESTAAEILPMVFALVGELMLFATHSKYVAYAELRDVKVTHFPDDSVIWQGSEDGMVSGKEFPDSAGPTAYEHANEALKIVMDKLVNVLDTENLTTTSSVTSTTSMR